MFSRTRRFGGTVAAFNVLLIVLSFLALPAAAQQKTGLPEGLPDGRWSLGATPYLGSDYASRPILVSSVMLDASQGLAVTHVAVKNQSNKTATSLTFEWILFAQDDRTAILKRGKTETVRLDAPLEQNQVKGLAHAITSFARIHKSLLKNGVLEGDYRIEIAVSDISFEDGTTWSANDSAAAPATPAFRQVSYRAAAPLVVTPYVPRMFCPKETCVYESGPLGGFVCGSTAANIICTNCGFRCCSTLCDGPLPNCPCS